MKKKDFVDYATVYANRTSNIRICPFWDTSGVSRVDDNVSGNFAAVIKFLQNNISTGGPEALCSKDEFLLIYNFQPITEGFLGIDIIIKSTKDIEDLRADTSDSVDTLHLVIDQSSTEIMNSSMLFQKLYSTEIYIKKEVPRLYGSYCSFIDDNTSYKSPNLATENSKSNVMVNDTTSKAMTTTTTTTTTNNVSEGGYLFSYVLLPLYHLLVRKKDSDSKNNKREREGKVENNSLDLNPPREKKQRVVGKD